MDIGKIKEVAKQVVKSKTIDANALITVAVIAAKVYGYDLDPATVAMLFGAVNTALRFVTKKPLAEKKGLMD